MTNGASLVAIRAVHVAAMNLTLACTEIVGARAMSIALPTAKQLGDPVPEELERDVERIEEELKK